MSTSEDAAAELPRRTPLVRRVGAVFTTGGPAFRLISLSNAASTAGDTFVSVALANTLFFKVPSAEARGNVALYLLLTIAPFIVLGPALGAVLQRSPIAYRYGLVASGALRAIVAIVIAFVAGDVASKLLYPLAFAILVLSRLYGISRVSLLPAVLSGPVPLVAANARIAQVGTVSGGIAFAIGGFAAVNAGPWVTPVLAMAAYVGCALASRSLPAPPAPPARDEGDAAPRPSRVSTLLHGLPRLRHLAILPRPVRMGQLATAAVRVVNGFLLLLLVFELRRRGADILDFAGLLAAAGGGFLAATVVSPWLERRAREEPMVVTALALEAIAAFIAAQAFHANHPTFIVIAAGTLAAAAGFAWGTAKLALDGLLQGSLPAHERGAAFTRSETLLALAWVLGALLPVGLPIKRGEAASNGLAGAGIVALVAQVVYVAALLVPRRATEPS